MNFFDAIKNMLAPKPAAQPRPEPEVGLAQPMPVPVPVAKPEERQHAVAFGRTKVMCWCGSWHSQVLP